MKKITLVAGARPNFMKIAPLIRALSKRKDFFSYRLVHTGQHYDEVMNEVFFRELGIPEPDVYLKCGSGTHAQQTAKIMTAFEEDCINHRPDLLMVVGDINSTLACSITAKKLQIPVAHVEAGLRSGDQSMPEEINRLVTDAISDIFFVTEPSGVDNLVREGHNLKKIHHVGHVMIDNLIYQKSQLVNVNFSIKHSNDVKKKLGKYGVVTLHRPSNVDDINTLTSISIALNSISKKLPLVFSVHPRTKLNMEKFGIFFNDNVHIFDSLPYMEFLNLWKDALVVLTDSGGLQEETTALGVPCLTLRDNTERPITLTEGTNQLVGSDMRKLEIAVNKIINGEVKVSHRPKLWDGDASTRIINLLISKYFREEKIHE